MENGNKEERQCEENLRASSKVRARDHVKTPQGSIATVMSAAEDKTGHSSCQPVGSASYSRPSHTPLFAHNVADTCGPCNTRRSAAGSIAATARYHRCGLVDRGPCQRHQTCICGLYRPSSAFSRRSWLVVDIRCSRRIVECRLLEYISGCHCNRRGR